MEDLFKCFEIIEVKAEENDFYQEETKTECDEDDIEIENQIELVKEFKFTPFLNLIIIQLQSIRKNYFWRLEHTLL